MKKILSILLILPACLCKAQTGRTLNFNKGDAFEKNTYIVSACQLQQGSHVIDITSSANATMLYKVDDVKGKDFLFTVSTNAISDTINSMGMRMVYNTGQQVDANSVIQSALNNIVKQPMQINVNSLGVVTAATKTTTDNNTILAYVGLQTQQYNAGDAFDVVAGFTANPAFVKGFSWTDSSEKKGIKTVTTYTIESIQDGYTGVSFTGSIAEEYYTTNVTGVLMVDNATGIIVQRRSETASTGYNVLNGVAYTEIRRTILAEYCLKKQ